MIWSRTADSCETGGNYFPKILNKTDMYQRAKQALDAGKDAKLGDVYICQVCGYTTEGEAPDKYPVCSAHGEQFENI